MVRNKVEKKGREGLKKALLKNGYGSVTAEKIVKWYS
jgi:hypothetical protein